MHSVLQHTEYRRSAQDRRNASYTWTLFGHRNRRRLFATRTPCRCRLLVHSTIASLEISKELDQQNKMLENVNTDFEEAIGGLDAVTRKTKELIKKSGEKKGASYLIEINLDRRHESWEPCAVISRTHCFGRACHTSDLPYISL